ncbi:MAG TPA: tripartite tricarboxylate transporter substrate binding protein [Eoetvoesiella sp.]
MKRILMAMSAAAGMLISGIGLAAYPERPITLIVPYASGGMGTTFGNLMSEALSPKLGQSVIVDFKPGANGSLGAAHVAKSAPDGYTLLMAVNSTMAINPNLYSNLTYDPIKDFTPVSMVYTSSNILVVNADSPYKTVSDLAVAAKANPAKLFFGSSGNGATPHLSGEMFQRLADAPVTHVPYKGIGPAVIALLGKQVDFVFSDTSALPHVKAGKLRALGVTGANRLGAAPDVPTMKEAGIDGFVINTWYSIVAPAGTPKEVVERLNKEIGEVVRSPAFQERLKAIGVDPAEDTSTQYLEKTIRTDLIKWRKFIDETGIKVG